MPKHLLPSTPVNTVNKEFFAPNDATASPSGMSKVATAFNYVSCVQKKVILIRSQSHLSCSDAGPIGTCWAHYFRTGENTSAVVVRYGAVLPDAPSSASSFGYTLRLFSTGDSGDTLVGSGTHAMRGDQAAGALTPGQVVRRSMVVDGLSADTEYHGWFAMLNQARIAWVEVQEVRTPLADDTVDGVCNPNKYHAEGAIYDEHAEDLTEANNLLWKHNGATLLSWAPDFADANAPTTTSASFADIIANSAGHYIDSTYHVTANRTAVPVKMGVKTYSVGTANAEFRLTDGTNNIDITGVACPSASNARWFTTTSTIPAGAGTWRMQARRTSGTDSVAVIGWSLFPYEA